MVVSFTTGVVSSMTPVVSFATSGGVTHDTQDVGRRFADVKKDVWPSPVFIEAIGF